ncbi:MAG: hypothetical protein KJN89_02050 [Gammaproteobacteria bacterium]|nr:hypothetical protein [Gammaproteobacteria bacterium]NNJ49128.1 hypothetical protein [Gammaproteobacteria bacterium]
MTQGAMEGGAAMCRMGGQKYAPRQLLLHCPTTAHPWAYAISVYPPSMAVYDAKSHGRRCGSFSCHLDQGERS